MERLSQGNCVKSFIFPVVIYGQYAICCMLHAAMLLPSFKLDGGTGHEPINCVCGELVRRRLSFLLILDSQFVRSTTSTSSRVAVIDPLIDRHHTLESGSIGVDDPEAIYRT
ncbi:hypothetical protein BO83DRAFT_26641 [Aspergillus eucalypticola CBS 122712]|uniref:Uncharacterized protein n=1 Tax=Aspergillus eucalypticola (strain CBS 122712 / IBT 29274) TaxID=1448314 RepID=A0A317VMT2_ASPEC|nr:uncharacterized protein BO83DRAFT_26641 [Aspergillus eucalypticola CBS 122712]PWY74152.1 hypothetical protein BO83DRAFT_26641 [Aspergillus eucalypticola CBS 122712]